MQDLDTVEPLSSRIDRHAYDRLIMLSDGVFAIVITLSALEIHGPEHAHGDWGALLQGLALPLIIFAVSFTVTSFYWVGQRRALVRMRRVDGWFTGLSLVFLAAVALIPAATKLMIGSGNGSGALVLYLGLIGLVALSQGVAWAYAAFVGDLLMPEVSRSYRWAHLVSTLATPIISCGLSLVAVNMDGPPRWFAISGIVVVVLLRRRLLARWSKA